MNNIRLQQILDGKIKVEELPKSVHDGFYNLLDERFKDRYKKIIRGFEIKRRENSPMSFDFYFGDNKLIRFRLTLNDEHYYGNHPDEPYTSVHIWYEDGGVHHGNAYGNQTNDVTRRTSIKHIKKLIPKIEEIYAYIETVANKHRDEAIQDRIYQLQDKVSDKLDTLQSNIRETKDFKKKYHLVSAEIERLITTCEVAVEKEKNRLQTLPEFQNPKKVLGIE